MADRRKVSCWASALAWTGAFQEAEKVLADLANRAEAIDDRLRIAKALSWMCFWGRYDVEPAVAYLLQVLGDPDIESGSARLVADIHQGLAGISLNIADPARALEQAQRAAAAQGLELGGSLAASVGGAALTYLGRCQEALDVVDEAISAATVASNTITAAELLFVRAAALSRLGLLEEAVQLLEWLRDVALTSSLQDATAIFGVLLGDVLLRQGRAASASRMLRDTCGLLSERDVLGYRPWALSGLARARALAGEEESAAAALDEARRSQPIGRHYDMSHYLAEIEVHVLAGRRHEALTAARAAVAWARGAGMPFDEAFALDAWVRLDPDESVAARLDELAVSSGALLLRALADHARALVDKQPQGLV